MDNFISEAIKQEYLKKTTGSKIYAVMLFSTEMELGISNTPNKWVNTKNMIFTDGATALISYADIKCPASQLIDAISIEELEEKMNEMISNFKNPQWLENELYPYL